ncbi:NAD(P)/FAD-dependent oxidoreductase [Natronorubrum sp. A-ect3]|uniref:NAD(P)/FAD-dependent oxidoreductase n=1 Tax=Natronorubrum sp. A-ect3 TaxID=3242698 RepID=UPI00359EAD23
MTPLILLGVGSSGSQSLLSDVDPVLKRRLLVGAVAGIVPGAVLSTVVDPWLLGLLLGPVLGLLYGLGFEPLEKSALTHAVGAAAMSIPAWVLVYVLGLSLVRTGQPAWTLDEITTVLPTLATWMGAGAVFGVLVALTSATFDAHYDRVQREDTDQAIDTRIVVLGGGFAGLTVGKRLEKRFGPDPTVKLTLVSDTNAILFTPMLAEVAAGSLEPTHVTTPLRTSLKRTEIVRSEAVGIDRDNRHVILDAEASPSVDARADGPATDVALPNGSSADHETIPYDHLVFALGSVSDYKGLEGVRAFAFDFKTLGDAMAIRNHVVDCFERTEREDDPDTRNALVTFVVAGAGFAGAELAGALNDFVRGMLVYYPNVPPEDVTVTVVHSRDRIVPELSESLAAYILERMRARGVTFELETYLEDADPESGVVTLSTGTTIETETLVWTAGNRPNPLVDVLGLPTERPGAISVDATLSVPGHEGLWAVGDCAAVPDPAGDRYPPTAEHAIRAGNVLADNIHASTIGKSQTPLEYTSPGSLVVVGYQTACAELWGRRFSGPFAWLLWRLVYLLKLPGTDRKIRVLVSWLIELVFPREIVQTMGERTQRRGRQ